MGILRSQIGERVMTNPLMQPAVLIVIGSMMAFMAGMMFFSIEDLVKDRQSKN